MDYQIKRRKEGQPESLIEALIFHTHSEAQTYADDMNRMNPDVHYWVVEVMSGPFVKDGNDIVPNTRKE